MFLGVSIVMSETKIDRCYVNRSIVTSYKAENAEAMASPMPQMIRKILRKELLENDIEFVENFSWKKKKQNYLNFVDRLTHIY